MESLSPEYRVITQCYSDLCSCIQQSPTGVATQLKPYGLLAPEDWTFITNSQNNDDKKAGRIVDTVLKKVELDSGVFHSFVSALEAAGTWTRTVVCELKKHHGVAVEVSESSSDSEPDLQSDVGAKMKVPDSEKFLKSASATPSSRFICPFCKKCTVLQFFSKAGCPKAPQHSSTGGASLFPYLDFSALTSDEKILLESRLTDDTRKIICLFAEMEDSLIVSLSSHNIDIHRLKTFAANIIRRAGTKEEFEMLKQSSTISEVFFALHPFKSFFHYEITEKIARNFGSPTDQQLMDEYIAKFTEFCERCVFQVPPNIFHDSDPNPGDKVFSVKLTKEGQASLMDVVAVRRKFANILNIEVFALQLCCVTEGCVCLRFLVSGHVAEKIFPLSPFQVIALQDIHVRIVDGPNISEKEDQVTRITAEKFELFKTQLAAAVPALATSSHIEQQIEEFVDVFEAREVDKLIDICLESLRIEGEPATEDGQTTLDVATQFQGADSAVVQTCAKAQPKSGKQLPDSVATNSITEMSLQAFKPSSGVGHQTVMVM